MLLGWIILWNTCFTLHRILLWQSSLIWISNSIIVLYPVLGLSSNFLSIPWKPIADFIINFNHLSIFLNLKICSPFWILINKYVLAYVIRNLTYLVFSRHLILKYDVISVELEMVLYIKANKKSHIMNYKMTTDLLSEALRSLIKEDGVSDLKR